MGNSFRASPRVVLALCLATITGRPSSVAATQSGMSFLDPPEPPPLPGPSVVDAYLFENPWPVAILLALASVVVFSILRNRRSAARAVLLAAVPLALGIAAAVLATAVQTTREDLRESTLGLVSAAARAESERVGGFLATDAVLFPPGGGTPLQRDEIMERVRQDLGDRWRLREWAVLEIQAAPSGDTGRTQVKVRATPEVVGFPNISWWRIGWRKDTGGRWRVISIEPASVTPEVERELR